MIISRLRNQKEATITILMAITMAITIIQADIKPVEALINNKDSNPQVEIIAIDSREMKNSKRIIAVLTR
jgi:hypothetical protein